MCGICGKVFFGAPDSDATGLIRNMTAALAHRGPDDSGYYQDVSNSLSVFLGHTRLSVLDLTNSGHQPMLTPSKKFAIVYNGEIYNYTELKEELCKKGASFVGTSDTEALLHLFAMEKEAMLPKLNGMFSFAAYDKDDGALYLARDLVGIKPLYYYKDDNKFLFASELKSILKDSSINLEIDAEALHYYLAFRFIPAPNTIFKGIKKLPPGHFLKLKAGKLIQGSWKNTAQTTSIANPLTFQEAKQELRFLLDDSVKRELVADVPVGALLSGGIDSSIIVALASKYSALPLKTFSIGYKEESLYDETRYAKEVATLWGTEHHEIKLDYKDVMSALPEALDSLSEPFADSSAIVAYIVCKAARSEVKVALSGDGSDELFAGYRKYLGEYYRQYYMMLPHFFRKGILEPIAKKLPDSKDNAFLEQMRRIKKFVSSGSETLPKRHFGWMEVFTKEHLKGLLTRYNESEALLPSQLIARYYENSKGDGINKTLDVDQNSILPYDMLTKVDLMSMRNSLEIRVPFLDNRVVELSALINGNFKLNKGKGKFILVEAFKDLLPANVTNRKKQGFEVPIGKWFRKELKGLFFDVVNKKDIEADGIFNYAFIEKLYSNHATLREDNSSRLYSIFVFMWWRKLRFTS